VCNPPKRWPFAKESIGSAKSPRPAAWVFSAKRYRNGESIERIAMTQESGKPVKPSTVCGHLFTAWAAGWPMPLRPLAAAVPVPTQAEWEAMERAETTIGVNIQVGGGGWVYKGGRIGIQWGTVGATLGIT
jgi:hypothetical protein